MDRTKTLLRGLPKTARVIEIGPSIAPLVPKRDGWDVVVIDHASREGLVVKYANDASVDTSRIEEVDYVWQGGSLADLLPSDQHGTFDAFIASHVIEHTTDIVAFLKAAETLLKPDGLVILALPDKRKCFDLYRQVSTTADAIEAHLDRRSRHTRRTQIDFAGSAANKEGAPGWAIDDMRPAHFVGSPGHGEATAKVAAATDEYFDAHGWVFVPASFEVMVLELAQAGYLGLRIEATAEAHFTEFYAWLRKGVPEMPVDTFQEARRTLHERVIVELAEQSRQIPGSPLHEASRKSDTTTVALAERVSRLEAAVFSK